MLKAVLFDLDETLVDRRATVLAAAQDQYRRLFANEPFTEEAYVEAFLELDDFGRKPKRGLFEELIAHFRIVGSTWQELLADRDAATVRNTRLHLGAAECLEELSRAGYRMAVVTNGRFPLQRDKTVAADIARFFAAVVVSEAEGVEKPHPDIFLSALARLGVEPKDALFVGDDPVNDVRGAQAAGLRAIFVPSFHHAACVFADAAVATLAEVPEAAQRLFAKRRSKDPLEGKTLEALLTELVTRYGWPYLGREVAINCFLNEPSLKSSLKFLRRTPWARDAVEKLYINKFKDL